ncbi:DUF6083 domain-containing protein [Streptomyces sp. DT203]|uniref:DUF6083 domain-containing protein n=1 Tax=Streptomyces sp. DT203 TaxID=3393424 RepID=UPI003CF31B5A
MNLWGAEPVHGAQCRIAHRVACPDAEPEDPWPWTAMLRQENERRAQRLFNLPDDRLWQPSTQREFGPRQEFRRPGHG